MEEILKEKNRIVFKIGTSTLTHMETGELNLVKMEKFVRILTDLHNQGKEVVVVSSGAIGVGRKVLGLKERPRERSVKQACAAVGQSRLMTVYQKLFSEYNQNTAQILMTKITIANDTSRHNAENTFRELLDMGVIPIVNENDTVATDELNDFSDNDTLSSYVAELIKTDLLVILSDIKGMYTADPNKNADAKIISVVPEVNDEVFSLAGGSASSLGTGGMVTKVKAADFLTRKGINMIIASGEDPAVLFDILDGEPVGTLFMSR
jgi:glutamate 5-kinase